MSTQFKFRIRLFIKEYLGSKNLANIRFVVDYIFLQIIKAYSCVNKFRTKKIELEKNNVLIFLPEMGMKIYVKAMVKIANSISSSKDKNPLFINCNGCLPACALKLTAEQELVNFEIICSNCMLNSKIVNIKNRFESRVLNFTNSIKINLFKLNYDELINFHYESINIGRLAYYDLSIFFKKDPSRKYLNEKESIFLIGQMISAINLIDFLNQILAEDKIHSVISIDEYCLSNVIRAWARKSGIKAFQAGLAYHFNGDIAFLTLSSNNTSLIDRMEAINKWNILKKIPLQKSLVSEIYDDLIFRMSTTGGHIFSKNYLGDADNISNLINLKDSNKVIAVFPSSGDEITALEEMSVALNSSIHQDDIFPNQIEWLSFIIDFARVNKDVRVIVKIHPRLLDTHKDVAIADELAYYEEMALRLPVNVKFIWPKDSVSAYDILLVADLALTSWGTMGLEIAKFGIPVITALTKSVGVTPGINLFKKSSSINEFLEDLLAPRKMTLKRDLLEACRWHYWAYLGNAIYCPDFVGPGRSLHNLPNVNFNAVIDELNPLEVNFIHANELSLRNISASAEELKALDESLNKLIKFLGKGISANKNVKLLSNLTEVLNQSIKEDSL